MKMTEPARAAALAGLPGVAQAFRPIRLGRQKLQGCRALSLLASAKRASFGCRQRHAWRRRGEARLPERREHAKGLAAAGRDRFRLEQQATAEQAKLDARARQTRLDCLLRVPAPRARSRAWHGSAFAPVSSRSAASTSGARLAAGRDSRRAAPDLGRALRGCHAATSATRRPCGSVPALRHRECRAGRTGCAGLGRFGQRRMVGEPEIEAKPDDDGAVGQIARPSSGASDAAGRAKRRSRDARARRRRSSRTRRARSTASSSSAARTVRSAISAARSGGKP